MAEMSRFFDHVDGDRTYNADDFAEYFRQILTTGVLDTGENLQVYVNGTDRVARIKVGKAWIEGYFYKLTEELGLILEEAHGTYDRIDRVVLRLDRNTDARSIKAFVKTGVPAIEPMAPILIREENVYEISLAQILVVHNTTAIPVKNVIDERLDSEVCGLANLALNYEEFALKVDMGDINDETLPSELKGRPLTEQIMYVLENAGQVKSVNNKTGEITLTYVDVGAVPTSRTVNGRALSSNIYLTAADVGAVPTSRMVNSKALTSNITIDVRDIPGLVATNLCIGESAYAGNTASIAIGSEAYAYGFGAIALGALTRASTTYAIAIGRKANAEGNDTIAIGSSASSPNVGEGVLGSSSIDWRVPGTFRVSGTKNFEIPHPKPEKKETHIIRHGTVETPSAGDNLYRWKIKADKDNDVVLIDLPDYFVWLNKDVQIWVNGQGHFGNGYGVLNREAEQLEIHCQYEGEYNILVIGTRDDDHPSIQDWDIRGVEREIGESWTGETYAFEIDEIIEVEEIKEVA